MRPNTEDLLYYLKLLTGSNVIYDFATVTSPNYMVSPYDSLNVNLYNVMSDPRPVCSSERFFSHSENMCSANMYAEGLWITYYQRYNDDDELELVLTAEYSEKLQGNTQVSPASM